MNVRRSVTAALLTAAPVAGLAAPASAGCYGTANTVLVCSTVTTGGTLYEDCVYLGGGTCTPVSVPGPAGCVSARGQEWQTIPICFK